MDGLAIFALLLYVAGAFAYGLITVSWIGEIRKHPESRIERVGGILTSACFVWFVLNATALVMDATGTPQGWAIGAPLIYLTCMFPPMIMHDCYAGYCRAYIAETQRRPASGWPTAAGYLIGHAMFLFAMLGFSGFLGVSDETTGRTLGFLFSLFFIVALAYSWKTMAGQERPRRKRSRSRSRFGLPLLFGVAILLFALIFLENTGVVRIDRLFEYLAKSLPLGFLFLATYNENRFEFFDLFIKRGISLLLTVFLLTGVFAVVVPWLGKRDLGPATPWIWAVVLLPAIMALPWIYQRLGRFLDNAWLGRRFGMVEGLKHFLSVLQSATDERDVVERAVRGLETIFRAPARVDLGLRELPEEFECEQDVPLRAGERTLGAIRMGKRANDAPYFSEDLALLHSLAEVLGGVLENVRLQRRRQEQEQVAQAMSLQASRSELKALRAQINPHFLFNALNAIAGLIHRDPLRADRAVEQLADVFRYTLRRSNNEWALLEEELDFVGSYLEVERARFGERLQAGVEVEEAAKSLMVPTMLVHTLVENAVKHGVASVRGGGRIEVSAARRGGDLVVEVADSGPGFADGGPDAPAGGAPAGGFGLRNVRERLDGHFDGEAELRTRRDEARGMTVVSLRMPLARLESRPGGEAIS